MKTIRQRRLCLTLPYGSECERVPQTTGELAGVIGTVVVENLIEEPLANGTPLGGIRNPARLSCRTIPQVLRRLVKSFATLSSECFKEVGNAALYWPLSLTIVVRE